ncbi:hypothetical protein PMAYCL1PPCAC_13891 [Pristionchus mayeri]|uniref:Uncharacterized protein n=1 Tax=Pristionchus mayeri TaxID=1317129 RepID=A0AAN4ZN08_9BILA|nr:hypothetical protein PMAYCL1PPCAC_13891 [Pristionchus mayeri]
MKRETEKVEQARGELLEKIIQIPRETTDRVLALERSHNETMTRALSYIQNVPRSILADKEAQQLDQLFGDIRRNVSDIRASYNTICEQITDGQCGEDMKLEAKKMSQLCETGRSQRTGLLNELDSCQNIDFHVKSQAKVGLLKMQNVVIAMQNKLFVMRNKKEQISIDDLLDVEGLIAQMETLFNEIPSLQVCFKDQTLRRKHSSLCNKCTSMRERGWRRERGQVKGMKRFPKLTSKMGRRTPKRKTSILS